MCCGNQIRVHGFAAGRGRLIRHRRLPFTNPAAPPGPADMPQYRNLSFESAARLNAPGAATFNQGTAARDNAERHLRDIVLFASVLFLVAIAQRFKVRSVRIATTAVALGLAACTTVAVLTLPRI